MKHKLKILNKNVFKANRNTIYHKHTHTHTHSYTRTHKASVAYTTKKYTIIYSTISIYIYKYI